MRTVTQICSFHVEQPCPMLLVGCRTVLPWSMLFWTGCSGSAKVSNKLKLSRTQNTPAWEFSCRSRRSSSRGSRRNRGSNPKLLGTPKQGHSCKYCCCARTNWVSIGA